LFVEVNLDIAIVEDSNGRRLPGFYTGVVHWIGSFDQCLSIQPTYTEVLVLDDGTNTSLLHDFHTKHCMLYYTYVSHHGFWLLTHATWLNN